MFVHILIRGVRRLFIIEMYTLMSMVGSDLHDRRGSVCLGCLMRTFFTVCSQNHLSKKKEELLFNLLSALSCECF